MKCRLLDYVRNVYSDHNYIRYTNIYMENTVTIQF